MSWFHHFRSVSRDVHHTLRRICNKCLGPPGPLQARIPAAPFYRQVRNLEAYIARLARTKRPVPRMSVPPRALNKGSLAIHFP